jgi:hypothetical protein
MKSARLSSLTSAPLSTLSRAMISSSRAVSRRGSSRSCLSRQSLDDEPYPAAQRVHELSINGVEPLAEALDLLSNHGFPSAAAGHVSACAPSPPPPGPRSVSSTSSSPTGRRVSTVARSARGSLGPPRSRRGRPRLRPSRRPRRVGRDSVGRPPQAPSAPRRFGSGACMRDFSSGLPASASSFQAPSRTSRASLEQRRRCEPGRLIRAHRPRLRVVDGIGRCSRR